MGDLASGMPSGTMCYCYLTGFSFFFSWSSEVKFLSPYIGRAWAKEAEGRMQFWSMSELQCRQGGTTWMSPPPFPIILSLGNGEKEHFFFIFLCEFKLWIQKQAKVFWSIYIFLNWLNCSEGHTNVSVLNQHVQIYQCTLKLYKYQLVLYLTSKRWWMCRELPDAKADAHAYFYALCHSVAHLE